MTEKNIWQEEILTQKGIKDKLNNPQEPQKHPLLT